MSETTESKFFSKHTGKNIDDGIDITKKAIVNNGEGQKTTSNFSLQVVGEMTFKNSTEEDTYSGPLTVDDYSQYQEWDSQNSITVRKTRKIITRRENTSDLIQESKIIIDYTLAENLNPQEYYIIMEVCRRTHGQYDWQIPETTYGDTGQGGRDKRLGYIVIADTKLTNLGSTSSNSPTEIRTRNFYYAPVPDWMPNGGYIDPKVLNLQKATGSYEITNNFFLPLIKPILPEVFQPDEIKEDQDGSFNYNYWLGFELDKNEFGIMGVRDDKNPLLIRFSLRKVETITENEETKLVFDKSLATSQIIAIGKPKKDKQWFEIKSNINAEPVPIIHNLYRSIK